MSAAECVRLAATPVFALMALLTAVASPGMPHMHGSMEHSASALSGMVPMYVLMSIFHSAPWLKRMTGRRGGVREP
ncbi:MAG TPA: hypothetical protein VGO53_13255 [Steroidobacteraceae bacterium]|nr:hypothetical protein [Steroidobacteraceae bacterium]